MTRSHHHNPTPIVIIQPIPHQTSKKPLLQHRAGTASRQGTAKKSHVSRGVGKKREHNKPKPMTTKSTRWLRRKLRERKAEGGETGPRGGLVVGKLALLLQRVGGEKGGREAEEVRGMSTFFRCPPDLSRLPGRNGVVPVRDGLAHLPICWQGKVISSKT